MPTHINVHIIRTLQVEDGYAFTRGEDVPRCILQAACVARMKGKHSGCCMSKKHTAPFLRPQTEAGRGECDTSARLFAAFLRSFCAPPCACLCIAPRGIPLKTPLCARQQCRRRRLRYAGRGGRSRGYKQNAAFWATRGGESRASGGRLRGCGHYPRESRSAQPKRDRCLIGASALPGICTKRLEGTCRGHLRETS